MRSPAATIAGLAWPDMQPGFKEGMRRRHAPLFKRHVPRWLEQLPEVRRVGGRDMRLSVPVRASLD